MIFLRPLVGNNIDHFFCEKLVLFKDLPEGFTDGKDGDICRLKRREDQSLFGY